MTQTVLVADDSKTIRRIVEMALKALPYHVVGIDSAQGAMSAGNHDPKVILLDYFMPDGSGYDVCRALKGDAATSGIPIVMMGGSYKNFDESLARQSGADAVLMKPFKTNQLIDALEGAISGTSAAPAPPIAAPPVAAPPVAAVPALATPTPPIAPPIYQAPPVAEIEPHTMPVDPDDLEQVEELPVASSQPRTPVDPAVGSQPKIATQSGSGLAAVGMSRAEFETYVREEVKTAVKTELPGLLRSVMGEMFQQKVLPKLMDHTEKRIAQTVESGLNSKIQEEVRSELERLLSED